MWVKCVLDLWNALEDTEIYSSLVEELSSVDVCRFEDEEFMLECLEERLLSAEKIKNIFASACLRDNMERDVKIECWETDVESQVWMFPR